MVKVYGQKCCLVAMQVGTATPPMLDLLRFLICLFLGNQLALEEHLIACSKAGPFLFGLSLVVASNKGASEYTASRCLNYLSHSFPGHD
jgi:hypothetical protein